MTSNAERIGRALSYLEEHLFEEVRLDDLAARACFSPFHFHRLFSAMVGRPPAAHIRRRRLTDIARRLIETDRPIVQLAFDCQFASQEAFTRAFERQHGVPPGAFRRRGLSPTNAQPPVTLSTLEHIMENVTRDPTVVELPEFHTIGMARIYDPTEPNDIPQLWGEFVPRIEEIPAAQPGVSYGVCICSDRVPLPGADGTPPEQVPADAPPRFEYVAAVGVDRAGSGDGVDGVDGVDQVPDGMVARTVPAARYLVFTHSGHISRIKETIDFIWGTWLPRSDYEPSPTPDFERYDQRFDGASGNGEFEIYIPIV